MLMLDRVILPLHKKEEWLQLEAIHPPAPLLFQSGSVVIESELLRFVHVAFSDILHR